jgi:N-acyl-D-amino-acid deacylase
VVSLNQNQIRRINQMVDLIIENARIADGSSRPVFWGNVTVLNGRIIEVGQIIDNQASKRLDAEGQVLAPGFIDIHSHSDTTLLVNPQAESKICQGVTTEIIGNCGNSLAPIAASGVYTMEKHLAGYEVPLTWRRASEYLDTLASRKPALNVGMLAGHGIIRRSVLGGDNRQPDTEELGKMAELLEGALEDGAFGLSTGLIYPPGFYAETDELIALAKRLRPYGGFYASHVRGEGSTLVEGVREAIQIGRASHVPVHISHHKAVGRQNWGKVKVTLALIDAARSEGLDVTADMYPYDATNTVLQTFLPRWVHEGGLDRLLERISNQEQRQQILPSLGGPPERPTAWENVVIAKVGLGTDMAWDGKSLASIAEEMGCSVPETVLEIIRKSRGTASVIIFSMCEEDICQVIQHPTVMIGSDGSALTFDGKLATGKPHPRNYGTFPRVISEYVRGKHTISLENAINKMTWLPAKRLGIFQRGLIAPGFYADLVLFDPDKIKDQATYQFPQQKSAGITTVMVNGESVVENGIITGNRPGMVLRRGRS